MAAIILTKVDNQRLEFNDGTVVVTWEHQQDCCEDVYADFTQLLDKVGQEFPNLHIEEVPNSGFRIGGEFIPCYNSQNGYYNDQLHLVITMCGIASKMNISDCALDQTY